MINSRTNALLAKLNRASSKLRIIFDLFFNFLGGFGRLIYSVGKIIQRSEGLLHGSSQTTRVKNRRRRYAR